MRDPSDVTKEQDISSPIDEFWKGKGEIEENCFLPVPYGDILLVKS